MRRRRRLAAVWLALTIPFILLPQSARADADSAALFKKHCGVCHILEKDGPKRQGPSLWGVLGRPIGSLEGFKYSKDLKASEDKWTDERLDKWLEKPKSVFKSTFMIYKQKDPEIRAKIIAFLKTASRQ